MLTYLLGADPAEVWAVLADEDGKSAVDTQALSILRFPNGTLAFVNCNQSIAFPHNDIVIQGTQGRITGRGITRARAAGELAVLTEGGEVVTPYPVSGAHRRALAGYTQAVLSGEQPRASGRDGLRSVRVSAAIARSAEKGQRVRINHEEACV